MKNELEIDLYHLDEAWMELPKLTEEWNKKTVEADIAAMNAKNELDEAKAKLDQQIRENPENFGLSKLTEASLSSAISIDPTIKAKLTEYYDFLFEHRRTKSYCNSIATKEKALQGLTKLYEAGYFASKPICAMASTITQEKETAKLNTETNKSKLTRRLKK